MSDSSSPGKSTSKEGGLFVALYDNDALSLYLQHGIYGFIMKPQYAKPSAQSRHYAVLADYACTREGMHVFFFLKRRIVYAGQITGNPDIGSFYLNGKTSPLGKEARAQLFWDESGRYVATAEEGVFLVSEREGDSRARCQPFIIKFEDRLGLAGKSISSDDLYFELGGFAYPLPSNSMQDMGFCTLTPGEATVALRLMEVTPERFRRERVEYSGFRNGEQVLFSRDLGIRNLQMAAASAAFVNESHVEFSIISNPQLLPADLRPSDHDVICRQVPISPFKPFQMDRADVCYYDMNRPISDGTLPNRIIELKKDPVRPHAIEQTDRYLRWLRRIATPDNFAEIRAYVLAPSFSNSALAYRPEHERQISLVSFSGQIISR